MGLLGRILDGLAVLIVCNECVRKSDRVVGTAGDFSCCERCQKSITSKTGKTVKPAEPALPSITRPWAKKEK